MRAALTAAVLLLASPAGAEAQLELVPVGSFDDPVALAAPPGDPARLFVAQRGGVIRVVKDGAVVRRPFADLSRHVRVSDEEGLLGIAFPRRYGARGRLYAFLVDRSGGDLQIRELRRSRADPDRAVRGRGRLVLAVPHRQGDTHNGGQLAFGPDGFLYAGTGDGGGSNDLEDDAADPRSLLGKILRIDPRPAGGRRHRIPAGNPFGNAVWAYGLRNPWRFSFDRGTGDLVIGDVGQGVAEEIDWAPAARGGGRGADYGWHCRQGNVATPRNPNDRRSPPLCRRAPRSAQAPAFVLDHRQPDGFCAIVGGFVVRDPGVPSLLGRYIFGDFCRPDVFAAVLGEPRGPAPTGLTVRTLTSFGEDACGRIYTASLGGEVRRLQENGAPSPCNRAIARARAVNERRAASRASWSRHRPPANPSASHP
jgi:glucose/arabinose dehydrogenase